MKKKVTSFLSVLFVLTIGIWQFIETMPNNDSAIISSESTLGIDEVDLDDLPRFERIHVSHIRSVDGDTFAFYKGDQEYRLRLLMVDTPESVKQGLSVQPYGKEASEFTEEQLVNNNVYLVFDEGEPIDNYGRFLAYVYVGENSLQEQLLEKGLGVVRYVNTGGDSFVEEFLAAQKIAQDQNLGVWSQAGYVTEMNNGYFRFNEIE